MVLRVPPATYFDGLVCLPRDTIPLSIQKGKKLEKKSKTSFCWQFSAYGTTIFRAKNYSKFPKLVLFGSWVGHWYMQTCFPMFVDAIKAFWGAKIGLEQKKVIFQLLSIR